MNDPKKFKNTIEWMFVALLKWVRSKVDYFTFYNFYLYIQIVSQELIFNYLSVVSIW